MPRGSENVDFPLCNMDAASPKENSVGVNVLEEAFGALLYIDILRFCQSA